MNSIKEMLQHLWAWFTGLTSKELDFVEEKIVPILKTEWGKLLPQLVAIATPIVTDLITSGKTSTEKKDAAIAALKADATVSMLNVADSVLNLVVETTYSNVQATQPASNGSGQ